MESALHPDLAKRQVAHAPTAPFDRISHLGALGLVQGTRHGGGTQTPAAEQRKDVAILDTFANMAMVRADMRDWVDYMQLAKLGDRWVIVNVLWERRPTSPAAPAR
jgi:aminoglycoside N3'-acetyltransferase